MKPEGIRSVMQVIQRKLEEAIAHNQEVELSFVVGIRDTTPKGAEWFESKPDGSCRIEVLIKAVDGTRPPFFHADHPDGGYCDPEGRAIPGMPRHLANRHKKR